MTSIAIMDARGKGVSSARVNSRWATVRHTVVPLAVGAGREGEREQDECDARADQEQADDVELLHERPRAPGEGRGRRRELALACLDRDGDEPEALGLLLGPEEGDEEGREGDGDEDGEHAVAPAPAGAFEDLGRDVGADEGVDDEGRGREARDEAAPLEGGDVRDDDGQQELEPAAEQWGKSRGERGRGRETCVNPLDGKVSRGQLRGSIPSD